MTKTKTAVGLYRFGCHAGLDPASRDLLHLSTGFRLGGRNDKSHSDNVKISSPKGEGFQPSPSGTLMPVGTNVNRPFVWNFEFLSLGFV